MVSAYRHGWMFGNATGDPRRRPHLVTNPADDEGFRSHALAALYPNATPEGFETHLRRRYPNVVVRARGLAEEPFVVWYVYREGRWIPRAPDRSVPR